MQPQNHNPTESLTASESANFVVPASTSATLNRITGGGVSTISGTVSSNGVVFFVNPNGMVFDASSRVSANGFVASTANISNFDFMRGSNFGGAFTTASTVNSAAMNLAGEITTLTKGAVAIIGPTVTNTGTITANQGMVILAAVDAATVDYRPRFSRNDGLALLTIAPNSGLAHGFAVSNSGTITSNGGQIALQAAAVLPSLPPEVSRPMAP